MLTENRPRKQHGLYCSFFLLILLFSSFSYAQDRLNQPAPHVRYPEKTLLLDITQIGKRLVAVGEQGVIIWSDDRGETWHQADVPVSVLMTAVTFASEQSGWAVGHDGVILHSTDGGETWSRIADGNVVNQWQVDRYERLNQQGNDPRRSDLVTDDFTLLYEDALLAQEEGATYPLLDISFLDHQHGFILGAYGLLLRTQDGGISWQVDSHVLPNRDRFHLNAMTHLQSPLQTTLFIAGEAGSLFRSDDQGAHWEALVTPYEGSFFGVATHAQRLFLMGLRGHLFYSDDLGEHWQPMDLKTTAAVTTSAMMNDRQLFAGSGGLVAIGSSSEAPRAHRLPNRAAMSAALAVDNQWLLVGESGVVRLTQKGELYE